MCKRHFLRTTHRNRWNGSEPGNVLDLVLVDDIDIISNLEIPDRLGCSDHLSIDLILDDDIDHIIPSNRVKRNFFRGNLIKLKNC